MAKKVHHGFTIVELLIVIVIIAILAAIVIVAYMNVQRSAIEAALRKDAQAASTIIANENTVSGKYPASRTTANGGKGFPASGNNKVLYNYIEPVLDLESGNYGPPSYEYAICNDQTDKSYRITAAQPTPTQVSATAAPRITTQYNGLIGAVPGPWLGPAVRRTFTFYGSTGATVTMGVSYYSCSSNTTVQWQRKVNSSAAYTVLPGATGATYTTPTLNSTYDGSVYKAVVTNPTGSVSTEEAYMVVDYEP